MNLTVNRSALLPLLSAAQAVADRRQTLPILGACLLRATDNGTLSVTASDLQVTVTGAIQGEVKKPGAVALDAKQLLEIVKRASGDSISISLNERNTATLKAGGSKYEIAGLLASDYPQVQPSDGVEFAEIDGALLVGLIDGAIHAISSEAHRPSMQGALLRGDGKRLELMALDGHRLARVSRPSPLKVQGGVSIPRKGLGEFRRLAAGKVGLGIRPNPQGYAFLRAGAITLSSKLMGDDFPVVDGQVKQSVEAVTTSFVIGRLLLLETMQRIMVVAGADRAVTVSMGSDGIFLRNRDTAGGSGEEHLNIVADGKPLEFTVSAAYFVEALESMECNGIMVGGSASRLDPVVLRPMDGDNRDDTQLVMCMSESTTKK
jgi:DNA polymerase-3 subunit beta